MIAVRTRGVAGRGGGGGHIGMCRLKGYGLGPFWSGIGNGFRGNYGSV